MTDSIPAPTPDQSVAIAYIHRDEVTYSFHHSILQLMDHDLSHNCRIWSGGYVTVRCGTGDLGAARNRAIADFLEQDRADWLWWVDTDMGFAPDTVDRLFEAADPAERPVVAALTFANRETDNDGMGGRRALAAPVIMYWAKHGEETGFDTRWDYPADSVIRCDGVGSACVLVHRSAFERIRDFQPNPDIPPTGPNWYTRIKNGSTGEMISEDLSFCCRLMALGIPVHVHTGVKTTHMKTLWLAEEDYWQQRAMHAPPPQVVEHTAKRTWTVPRYAIIPTHNRPARLLSLVASLGSQCDHIVIVDNASTPPVDEAKLQDVAGRAIVDVIRDDEQPPHLSRFWNVMFDEVNRVARDTHLMGEWDVAVFNDDAVVPAGWYDACANALRAHPTAAVAHTGAAKPLEGLFTDLDINGVTRMCPWAFVVRGELGLRADESMRWWYFDNDYDWQARQAGGVLAVKGPMVVNALANSTTQGVLAEQAQKDRATFEAKWS